MKARKLYAIVGIFAMCAFSLVFLGCSDGSENSPTPPPPPLPIPVAADFVIGNLSQIDNDIVPVTIAPKSGKSNGEIFIYYNGLPTLPANSGAYAVTFDVEEATGWEAVSGLAAGTLVINDIIIDNIPDLETSLIPDPDLEASLSDYLSAQPDNDKNTPYYIAIKIDNTDNENKLASLRRTLNKPQNTNKYVYLDLSGSSITTIPDSAFYGTSSPYGCNTLAGITISDSVTSIGLQAFYHCTNLASVTIGNNVTSIEGEAFQACISLTSVTIPDSVTSIGGQAFRDCTSLASVTFQGMIAPKKFSENMPFPGIPWPNDLRIKFYAEDPNNGTPGTYTTTAPVGNASVWTRQP